ncbi:MAG: hypothetical protein H6649_02785 [Caldilineae bacterium]|nr:hypothetical protein [Caldilineae bacterium]
MTRYLEREQKQGRKPGGRGTSAPYALMQDEVGTHSTIPRLFSYINGGEPEAKD